MRMSQNATFLKKSCQLNRFNRLTLVCKCGAEEHQSWVKLSKRVHVFSHQGFKDTCKPPRPTIAQIRTAFPLLLFVVSLQHMGKGDDTVREALHHLRDLMDYTHLFTFDANTIYVPNVHIESEEMCSCKEFIARELLKTLVSADITDQDAAAEPRAALRLLQHNIRFLLQRSTGGHCLKDRLMVRKTHLLMNGELTFIRRCFAFFQDWMYRCSTSSDV